MTVFLSHSAWGAQAPNRQSGTRGETTHLFVHHSATAKPSSIEEAKAQWRAIQADHLQRTVTLHDGTVILWADVAYNLGVSGGVILEGRGWDAKSGGTGPGQRVPHPSGSWDNVSVSICVLGNYQTDTLDADTRTSLVAAMNEAHIRYGNLTVMGDRDVNFTSCCGDNLYPLIGQLWAEATMGEDDVTPEQLAAMIGPLDRCKAIEGVVHIHLVDPDGSDAGWWPLSDVLEFNHRHAKATDLKT